MSFTFQWPRFSDQFHADAIQMLTAALNKGNKPPVIADTIEVVELEMGTQPPELEIRDIGDLTLDQFRGIFRLTYSGDAHLVLRTKVQANPLNHKQPDIHLMGGSRGMLAAKHPLVVPMLLRLSHFKLNSYVVLVVSKQKGITLVFKTDPLQNVDINSTFDSIAVIQKFIQREIEEQLRQMFKEDLPGIIHRLSQQWVKAKVEAPYLSKRTRPPDMETMSTPPMSRLPRPPNLGLHPLLLRRHISGSPRLGLSRSPSTISLASTTRVTAPSVMSSPPVPFKLPVQEPATSFPDIENFDPTYGLRPDGLPTKSLFSGFGRLFAANKGLASLTEEPNEESSDIGSGSFDLVEWEDTIPDYDSPPPSATEEEENTTEYESIPAVGGGVITRPRIFHSQSHIQPSASTSSLPSPFVRGASSMGPSSRMRPVTSSSLRSLNRLNSTYPYLGYTPAPTRPLSELGLASDGHDFYRREGTNRDLLSQDFRTSFPSSFSRPVTPDSSRTQFSPSSSELTQSVPTPPFTENSYANEDNIYIRQPLLRRLSGSSSTLDGFHSGSPPLHHHVQDADPKIVLRPALNNSISQLSTLSHSNHTLSPYTRSLEHFTVRSVPHRGTGMSGLSTVAEKQPVKAKRKRTYRLARQSAEPSQNPNEAATPSSPTPPSNSEFDESDMDHYFRSRDDTNLRYPNPIYDVPYAHQRRPHDPV